MGNTARPNLAAGDAYFDARQSHSHFLQSLVHEELGKRSRMEDRLALFVGSHCRHRHCFEPRAVLRVRAVVSRHIGSGFRLARLYLDQGKVGSEFWIRVAAANCVSDVALVGVGICARAGFVCGRNNRQHRAFGGAVRGNGLRFSAVLEWPAISKPNLWSGSEKNRFFEGKKAALSAKIGKQIPACNLADFAFRQVADGLVLSKIFLARVVSGTFFAGTGDVHGEGASFDFLLIKPFNGFVRFFFACHRHKSKASRPPGFPVIYDSDLHDVAVGREKIQEIVFSNFEREVSNK